MLHNPVKEVPPNNCLTVGRERLFFYWPHDFEIAEIKLIRSSLVIYGGQLLFRNRTGSNP